jgi:hypothetical protein
MKIVMAFAMLALLAGCSGATGTNPYASGKHPTYATSGPPSNLRR